MALFNPYSPQGGRIGAIRVGLPNVLGQNLAGMTNPTYAASFGYGADGENQGTRDYTFGSLYSMLAPSLAPAARRALLANRAGIENAYQDYIRQTGRTDNRLGDFAGQIDWSRTWREMPAFEGYRSPYSARVSYRSY